MRNKFIKMVNVSHPTYNRTLIISSVAAFSGLFLLAQTYAGYLSNNYILCSVYLACTGAAGAASYLCALDSQVNITSKSTNKKHISITKCQYEL